MKYRNWNFLVNASLSLFLILFGAWGIIGIPSNEPLYAVIFVILMTISIIIFIISRRISHDRYDEALKECENEAYRMAYMLILAFFMVGLFLSFFYKVTINNLFYWFELIYGITYIMPSLCLIVVEKRTLREISDGTEE